MFKNTQQLLEEHNSMAYHINYRVKYFSEDDTIDVAGNCKLIRIPTDTVFGGFVWFRTADSIEKYYNLKSIYWYEHRKKIITEFQQPANQKYALRGNITGDILKVHFMKPDDLLERLEDSTTSSLMADTVLNKESFWVITINYPDDPPSFDMAEEFWVSKQSFLIHKIRFWARFQTEHQYNEWNISNIEFDKFGRKDLEDKFKNDTTEYKIEPFVERSEEEERPLQAGTMAPPFTAISYSDSATVQLSDFKGKVVLIDFWYMSCYPCTQAIPHLRELHQKYHDNGFSVLGLNPFDDSEKRLKKLPAFLDYNKLDYPFAFIDREVTTAYNIHGYPTFYIIDRTGKIHFSQIGFGEKTAHKMDSIVESILK